MMMIILNNPLYGLMQTYMACSDCRGTRGIHYTEFRRAIDTRYLQCASVQRLASWRDCRLIVITPPLQHCENL